MADNTLMQLPQGNFLHVGIADYLKGHVPMFMRRYRIWDILMNAGKMSGGHTGQSWQWQGQYRTPPTQVLTSNPLLTFTPQDVYETFQLDSRGIITPDAMSYQERIKFSGDNEIINRFEQILPNLTKSAVRTMTENFYVDGNSTAIPGRPHGINSFMSVSGAATNGYVGINNDNYAGVPTALFTKGGSWDLGVSGVDASTSVNIWPRGRGSEEAEFSTPLVLDTSDTLWASSTKTFDANARQQLDWAIAHTQGKNGNYALENSDYSYMGMFSNQAYLSLTRELAQSERATFAQGDSNKRTREFGFGNSFNYQGTLITSEYTCPHATGTEGGIGFLIDLNNVEVWYVEDQPFVPLGPTFSHDTMSWKFSVHFLGNYVFGRDSGIKNFAKFVAIT